MLFPTEEFLLIFLPITLCIYYLIPQRYRDVRNLWLLAASLIFYAWGEPLYVLLMISVIAFDHMMALIIDKSRNTIIFALTILVNIGVLIWFKYFSSVLPIGISFYTFQAMSYVIDVYRSKIKAEKNPLYTGLYISFFPQLIAGPIVRYETIAAKIRNRSESIPGFASGAERFVRGLIKKVLIANRMAVVADAVWALVIGDRLCAGVSLAWLGAVSYTLQIFFDFSGYSDMAIGLGAMFGFDLPENFDHPYIAKSVTEFWRRWHITLSGWFRDYVYIPMGGSRVSKGRLVFNLFVVWLLTGMWHGSDLTFVIWGMIYFAVLTVEKLAGVKVKASETNKENDGGGSGRNERPAALLTNIVKHLYTLIIVVVAWVFFRSDSLPDALGYIKGMFPVFSTAGSTGDGQFATAVGSTAALAYIRQNLAFYIAALILCMPVRARLAEKLRGSVAGKVFDVTYGIVLAACFVLALSYIYNNAYSPFIYFNF